MSASGIMGCRWDSGGREVRSLSSPYWQAASIDTSPSSLSTTASHARDEKGGRRYFALSPKCQDPLVTSIRTLCRGGWRKTQRRISHFSPPHILKTVPEMRMSGSAKKGSVFVLPQQTIYFFSFSFFLRGCLPFHLFSLVIERGREGGMGWGLTLRFQKIQDVLSPPPPQCEKGGTAQQAKGGRAAHPSLKPSFPSPPLLSPIL